MPNIKNSLRPKLYILFALIIINGYIFVDDLNRKNAQATNTTVPVAAGSALTAKMWNDFTAAMTNIQTNVADIQTKVVAIKTKTDTLVAVGSTATGATIVNTSVSGGAVSNNNLATGGTTAATNVGQSCGSANGIQGRRIPPLVASKPDNLNEWDDDNNTYAGVIAEDGKCWLASNLGVTSSVGVPTDNARYGWLYQWGRPTDGHQQRESLPSAEPKNTTATQLDWSYTVPTVAKSLMSTFQVPYSKTLYEMYNDNLGPYKDAVATTTAAYNNSVDEYKIINDTYVVPALAYFNTATAEKAKTLVRGATLDDIEKAAKAAKDAADGLKVLAKNAKTSYESTIDTSIAKYMNYVNDFFINAKLEDVFTKMDTAIDNMPTIDTAGTDAAAVFNTLKANIENAKAAAVAALTAATAANSAVVAVKNVIGGSTGLAAPANLEAYYSLVKAAAVKNLNTLTAQTTGLGTIRYDWASTDGGGSNRSVRWRNNLPLPTPLTQAIINTPVNPCPIGYHVPSIIEWRNWARSAGLITVNNSGVVVNNCGNNNACVQKALGTQLKLPVAGSRNMFGEFENTGTAGEYWSSDPDTTAGTYNKLTERALSFRFSKSSGVEDMYTGRARAEGLSVRCIQN